MISRGFYFHEISRMQSFPKIKLSQNDEITLLVNDVGESIPSLEF